MSTDMSKSHTISVISMVITLLAVIVGPAAAIYVNSQNLDQRQQELAVDQRLRAQELTFQTNQRAYAGLLVGLGEAYRAAVVKDNASLTAAMEVVQTNFYALEIHLDPTTQHEGFEILRSFDFLCFELVNNAQDVQSAQASTIERFEFHRDWFRAHLKAAVFFSVDS